jgi:hypothetical protein
MTEQRPTLLKPGDVVRARVKHVAVFGIFFDYRGDEILVLIPDVSWIPCFASCEQVADVGDEFHIKIVHHAEERRQYSGSIRAVHPESNPWNGSWQLQVGDQLEPTVVRVVEKADRCGNNKGLLLELRPAAYVMLCGQDEEQWEKGRKCVVIVTEIDHGRRKVVLQAKGRTA